METEDNKGKAIPYIASETSLEGWKPDFPRHELGRANAFRNFLRGMETRCIVQLQSARYSLPKLP